MCMPKLLQIGISSLFVSIGNYNLPHHFIFIQTPRKQRCYQLLYFLHITFFQFRIPLADLEKLSKAKNEETQRHILDDVARELPVSNRTITGAVRFCEKCQHIKPDRTHHCSVCGVCVLKMDHHCPWINNCVNFSNYKFFVLFLGYALFYCIYVALSSLRFFLLFWRGALEGGMGRFHIVFLFFVAGMFAVSLVSLFAYHVYLVLLNRSTLGE